MKKLILLIGLIACSSCWAQSGTGGSHTVTSSVTVPDTSAISSVFRAPGPIHPYLPLSTVNVTLPNTSGYTALTATSAGDLQTKLNTALAGCDNGGGSGATGYVISIAPASVFSVGSGLTLNAGTCTTSKIIVQTTGFSGVRNTRLDPSTAVGTLASLRSTSTNAAVITCLANIPCGPVWFLGLELDCAPASGTCFNTWIPNNTTDTPADLPHDLIFDHVYAHEHATTVTTRCLLLSGNNIAVIDSFVSDCHSPGQDSQGLECFSGGPWLVQNNFMEGAGENVLCGGGNIGGVNVIYGITNHDMTFSQNWFYKPLQWYPDSTSPVWEGITWDIKNNFEMKMGVRVLVQYNVLQNLWFPSAQTGGLILQNGAITSDSFFGGQMDMSYLYNHLIGGTHWMEAVAFDNSCCITNSYRLEVSNNLWEDVGANWGTTAYLLKPGYVQGMIVDHNTSTTTSTVQGTSIISIYQRTGPFYFSNNITQHGTFGFNINSGGVDNIPNLNIAFGPVQAPTFLNNAIQGMSSGTVTTWNAAANYSGTTGPAAMSNIGFVNAASAGGDYRLCTGVNTPSAPCAGASVYIAGGANGCTVNPDGTGGNANCGADIATITTQTAAVQTVPSLWPDSLSGGGITLTPSSVVCNNSNTIAITPVAGTNGGSTFVQNGLDVLFNGTKVTPGVSSTISITITPPTTATSTVPITVSNFGLPITASLSCL